VALQTAMFEFHWCGKTAFESGRDK